MNFNGPGGIMALYVRDGALLAVDEINKSGGISGRPLKLFVRDDKGTPEGIKEVDHDLIKKGVVAIIGHRNAKCTLLAYPVVTREGVLLIGPACASSKLTGKDDLFIRTTFYDDILGKKIANYFGKLNKERVVCVVDHSNDMYSLDLFEKLSAFSPGIFTPLFINSERDPSYPQKGAQVTHLNPQAILFITNPFVTAFMAQSIRAAGCHAPFYATTWAQTQDLYRFGDEAVSGLKIFTFVRPNNPYTPFQRFVKNMKEMGITPNVRNALGYEAVMILAEGLRKAKIITSMALKEAMTNKRFKGVINSLELDRYGDPHRPLWLVKVMENGQMKTLRKVP
jgi:branched-chain amino acid transport system substrate-binding protein